ncbi:MAG: hypothetical protein IGS54_20890 [Elainella sp. C42_A2020_010]|nr:hypothetical protein [Elainella sp. C42_A2020_010]
MEFLIDSVERDGEIYCVRGVCTQGRIDVGATFSKAYKKVKEFSNNEVRLVGIENNRVVKLRVEKITAYRRTLTSLYQGTSGEICLIGEGGDDIGEKDTLASEG